MNLNSEEDWKDILLVYIWIKSFLNSEEDWKIKSFFKADSLGST